MKKFIYVAEILIEVVKVLLPFVKARQISIDRADDRQMDDEAAE